MKNRYRLVEPGVLLTMILMVSVGCSGKRPDGTGNGPTGLRGCPGSPNCVSSEATDTPHAVEPFCLKGDPGATWALVRNELDSRPGWSVVTATGTYIHAECKSRVFRFVDDLELHLDPSTGIISIRSASRVGYWDFGANRRRVERLRRDLKAGRLIE